MTAQAGKVYRYVRFDADQDITSDPVMAALDADPLVWATVDYIAPVNWPPSVAAADAGTPVAAGKVGYWFRLLTGPGTSFPLQLGTNVMHGKLTDTPEEPHFGWRIPVSLYE